MTKQANDLNTIKALVQEVMINIEDNVTSGRKSLSKAALSCAESKMHDLVNSAEYLAVDSETSRLWNGLNTGVMHAKDAQEATNMVRAERDCAIKRLCNDNYRTHLDSSLERRALQAVVRHCDSALQRIAFRVKGVETGIKSRI